MEIKREVTTIEVRGETWRELNRLKYVGESFDGVISRLLEDRRSFLLMLEAAGAELPEK